MKNYEAICILNPRVTEEKLDSLTEKFKKKIESSGGKIGKIEKWGKKRLPYRFQSFKDLKDGLYLAVFFQSEPKVPKELENILTVTEDVVRFQICKAKDKEEVLVKAAKTAPEEEKVEIAAAIFEEKEIGKPE